MWLVYFQGFLLQHNESEAMAPAKLQEKITDMLTSNPDIAEAVCTSNLRCVKLLITEKNDYINF